MVLFPVDEVELFVVGTNAWLKFWFTTESLVPVLPVGKGDSLTGGGSTGGGGEVTATVEVVNC